MSARHQFAAVLVGMFALGCGGPAASVTGRVTCQGKPVVGVILFSPKSPGGEVLNSAGPAVQATLSDEGTYELRLSSLGKHVIVVMPRDVAFRPKAGVFDYPCDRSPLEREIVAGDNDVTIELAKRNKR